MIYRRLGKTDLRVPLVAFGAGPVPALMTGGEGSDDSRVAVLRRALDLGVDWFDTAAGYGEGASERNLGESLARLEALDAVRIATKVRLAGDDFLDIATAVRRSVVASLERLRVTRVVLLQLHNAITLRRGDEAASISLDDVLDRAGWSRLFDVFATTAWWIGLASQVRGDLSC
jgi:aryl-alcohol dehydrogenase-like predicted oxidoreductase